MALSVLLAMLLGQGEVGVATKHVTTDVSSPLAVAEPVRLAVTPILDGKLDDEEWDPFANTPDSRSFLEWEPGKFYVAGVVPKGHDLLISIDLNDDGWLVGKDNLEVRASLQGDKVVLKARTLDTTKKTGPEWSDAPTVVLGSDAVAKEGDTETTYELALGDTLGALFNPTGGKKYGIRYDVIPSDGAEQPSFVPRAMAEVTLGMQRNAGMPKDLRVKVESGFGVVTPGESIRLRTTFVGNNTMHLQKFEAHSEGLAKDYTGSIATPFPNFDGKGRAFVDYNTKVAPGATIGYRVMRATVTAADGLPGIAEASYRIAPVVDFVLRTKRLKTSDQTQVMKIHYGIRSNSGMRVIGGVGATLPAGWKNLSPEDKGFILYRKGWIGDRALDVEIPAGTEGTFPIKLRSVLGDQVTEQTVYVTVGK